MTGHFLIPFILFLLHLLLSRHLIVLRFVLVLPLVVLPVLVLLPILFFLLFLSLFFFFLNCCQGLIFDVSSSLKCRSTRKVAFS